MTDNQYTTTFSGFVVRILPQVAVILLFFVLGLLTNYVFANGLSYTEDELNAFSKQEAQLLDEAMQHSIQIQVDKSQNHQTFWQEEHHKWQQKLDPKLLKGGIDIPEPTENPNAAPTGMMVFVSLTMPDAALKSLLKQSEHWQVPLVIRGVLPEGFPATAARIKKLIEQDGKPAINSGFAIMPEWFTTFNVTDVPTFVVVKPNRCLPKQPCTETDFDLIKGNVSMMEAMGFFEEGDAKEVVAKILARGQD